MYKQYLYIQIINIFYQFGFIKTRSERGLLMYLNGCIYNTQKCFALIRTNFT